MSKAPPTPCTGSTMTAAVFSVTWLAMSATSRRLIQLTSNGARGRKNHFCGAPQVVEAQAAVRPWKLCSTAATCVRPGRILNAILKAFSLASAPELIQNTLSNGRRENCEQLLRGARADFHGHGIGLEIHLRGLVGQRLRPALVAVAQRGHGVAAVQIQHLAAIARVQPDAVGADHFDGILRVDRREAVGG